MSYAKDFYAASLKASGRDLERDAELNYYKFKAIGCNALSLTSYDGQSYVPLWTGLKGKPVEIAPYYHDTDIPGRPSPIIVLLDLNVPFREQWQCAPGIVTVLALKSAPVIAETLRPAIDAFDRTAFDALPARQQLKALPRSVTLLQLDKRLASQGAAAPKTMEPASP